MCSLGIKPITFALLTQCSTPEPQEHCVPLSNNRISEQISCLFVLDHLLVIFAVWYASVWEMWETVLRSSNIYQGRRCFGRITASSVKEIIGFTAGIVKADWIIRSGFCIQQQFCMFPLHSISGYIKPSQCMLQQLMKNGAHFTCLFLFCISKRMVRTLCI